LLGFASTFRLNATVPWRVLGDDHTDTLESMNILAVVRRELGEQ